MYKKIIIIVFVILITVSISFGQDLSDWSFSRNLEGVSEGYNQFYLDENVYKHTKKDLEDLRILNSENEFIPFFIKSYNFKDNIIVNTYKSNKVLQFQKNSSNYIDFKLINEKSSKDILINKIKLDFDIDKDFLYDIKLYGSYDNMEWNFIKSDKIYKTFEGFKNKIDLKKGLKYKYYRLEFLNEYEDVFVSNLSGLHISRNFGQDYYIKKKEIDFNYKNKGKTSNININNNNLLKIKQIIINSKDVYDRYYTVKSKNTELDNYNYKDSGRVYNIDLESFTAKDDTIDFNNYNNDRLIRITIQDQDNKPIIINSIKIRYYIDKLVFEAKGNEEYKLFIGNKKADKPEYDIERFKNYITNEDKELVKLGNMTKTPVDNIKSEKSLDYKFILNVLIILLSIVLVIIISRHLKDNE
mgnify:CR=1 FL=1